MKVLVMSFLNMYILGFAVELGTKTKPRKIWGFTQFHNIQHRFIMFSKSMQKQIQM